MNNKRIIKILNSSIDYFTNKVLSESGSPSLTIKQTRVVADVIARIDIDQYQLENLADNNSRDIIHMINYDEGGRYVSQLKLVLEFEENSIIRYNEILRRIIVSYQTAASRINQEVQSPSDTNREISQRLDKIDGILNQILSRLEIIESKIQ